MFVSVSCNVKPVVWVFEGFIKLIYEIIQLADFTSQLSKLERYF